VQNCSTLSHCTTETNPEEYKNELCKHEWESCGMWQVPGQGEGAVNTSYAGCIVSDFCDIEAMYES